MDKGGASASPIPQGQIMEVQVIKSFMFAGKAQPAGAIIDMPIADAHYAIGLKRAAAISDVVPVEVKPAKVKKASK
jgi:hypothetical protein